MNELPPWEASMKATPLLFLVICVIGCGGSAAPRPEKSAGAESQAGAVKPSADPAANQDAVVMADFTTRVEKYADLHKDLAKGSAKQKDDTSAEQINKQKDALAAKIQAARAGAKHGEIFTPDVRQAFRRLLAPELKGEDGRDAKAVLKDDAPAPGTVPFKVNAKYPESQPKPTMPVNLLQKLPTLPEPLEYRVVGQHLLLIDTAADLIVDYALNVVVT
jgi:hypothetical protein